MRFNFVLAYSNAGFLTDKMKGSVLSVLVLICVTSYIEGHVDPTPPPITVGKVLYYSNYFCNSLS